MLHLRETNGLVLASAAAAGNAEVTRAQDAFRHIFLVTMSVAASVWVEAAVEPVLPAAKRWVVVSGVASTSTSIAVSGNFTQLRVVWSGNTGLVTVDLVQSAMQTAEY